MLEKKHWWFEHQFLLDLHSYFGNINMIYIPYTIYKSYSETQVDTAKCIQKFGDWLEMSFVVPSIPIKGFVPSKPPQAIRSKSCKLRIGWFMWRQWKCGFKWFNVSCNCWCFVDGSGAICCWLMRCLYGPVAWQSSESSWIASGVFWSKLICIVMLSIFVALTARYRCNFPAVFFEIWGRFRSLKCYRTVPFLAVADFEPFMGSLTTTRPSTLRSGFCECEHLVKFEGTTDMSDLTKHKRLAKSREMWVM